MLVFHRLFRRNSAPFLHRSRSVASNTRLCKMAQKLEDLPSISKISDNVVRVLGQNPGKATLQGTNTYIVGAKPPYILLDTAEGKPEYLSVLSSALDTLPAASPTLPDISDIIISHWHLDHIGGLPTVLSLLLSRWQARNPTLPSTSYPAPRLHKFPIPPNTTGPAASKYNHLPHTIQSLSSETFTPTPDGKNAFHDLHHNQLFHSSSSPTIRVLHTPGHTIDSIALHIVDDYALYTADTILGQGSSIFDDLRLYLSSLNSMLQYGQDDVTSYRSLYPGHGPVVKNGREFISTYIKHRLEREEQILEVLHREPAEGNSWSTRAIVKDIYASYPEDLLLFAARSIHLHLTKLEEDHCIDRVGGEGVDTAWKLVTNTLSPSL